MIFYEQLNRDIAYFFCVKNNKNNPNMFYINIDWTFKYNKIKSSKILMFMKKIDISTLSFHSSFMCMVGAGFKL